MVNFLTRLIQRFLGYFFELLYTRFAYLYDAVANLSSMGQWNHWRSTAIIDLELGAVLELGHGPGHLLAELAQAGYTATGIDPSKQMSHLAQSKMRKKGYRVDLVRGRAQALPFADQSFRNVLTTFPSNYIIDPATLLEARRVLSIGGALTIVGMIEITGKSAADRFARWLYAITGQSGTASPGWQAFLSEQGFNTHLDQINLGRSLVTRIIAKRE